MRALGIIPAKGSSQGVENKNMRKVAGEPLIDYAIRTANSYAFVIMSDDDRNFPESDMPYWVCQLTKAQANGDVASPSRTALLHVERHANFEFDAVFLLQPDSPIRTPIDIDNCLKMLEDNPDADGVISVYKVEDAHPAHMYDMSGGRLLEDPRWVTQEVAPRQDLEPVYHRNGAIYAVRRDTLMNEGWIPKKKLGYVMPRELSLTIDTEFDLMMAERQVQLWKEGKLTKRGSAGSILKTSIETLSDGSRIYDASSVPPPA